LHVFLHLLHYTDCTAFLKRVYSVREAVVAGISSSFSTVIVTKSQHPSVPEIRSGARVGTVLLISEDEDEFGVAIG
jgi:hypothetical protein